MDDDEMRIGIFSIFTGDYKVFYRRFVKNMRTCFFKDNKRKWVILSDVHLKRNRFLRKQTKTRIVPNDPWPYNTLNRFHYFRDIVYKEFKDLDYVFFINSNAKCCDHITVNDIDLNKDFTFVLHDNHTHEDALQKPFERNTASTACYIDNWINPDYIGGRFIGAKPSKFLEMSNKLIENIEIDNQNNVMAIFHDESHLNWFYNTNKETLNYNLLDINYHIPEQHAYREHFTHPKLRYINKHKKRYKHLNFTNNTKTKY